MASCLVPLPLLAALGVILTPAEQKIQRKYEEKRFCSCFPETRKRSLSDKETVDADHRLQNGLDGILDVSG